MPGPELVACLTDLPGTDRLEIVAEDDGCTTVKGHVAPRFDPRDEASRRLQSRNAVLRELKLDLPSLEDYFRQVTRAADAEEPQPTVAP